MGRGKVADVGEPRISPTVSKGQSCWGSRTLDLGD